MIDRFINKIKEYLYFDPQGIHGIMHTKRVLMILNMIFSLETLDILEKRILAYVGLYHDIGRINNFYDITHGKKSYDKLISEGLIDTIDLNKEDIEIMKYIIANHSIPDEEGKKNIIDYNIKDTKKALKLYEIFKDADGLDRVRIGDLNAEYLRREISKTLIPAVEELFIQLQQEHIGGVLSNNNIDKELIEHCMYLQNKGLYHINIFRDHITGIQYSTFGHNPIPFKIYLPEKQPSKLYHATTIKNAQKIIQDGYMKGNDDINRIQYNKVFFSSNISACACYGEIMFEVNAANQKIYNYVDSLNEYFTYENFKVSNCKIYKFTNMLWPHVEEMSVNNLMQMEEKEEHFQYTPSSSIDELTNRIEQLTQAIKEKRFL